MNIEKHMDWIRKIAHSWHNTHPELEFEDLFAQACLACVRDMPKYNPARGAETTFLAQAINSELKNMLEKETKWRATNSYYPTDVDTIADPTYTAELEWENLMAELSPEAQYICSIVQDMKEDLPTHTPRKCRGIIAQVLQKSGWGTAKIWNVTREIKCALS